MDLQPTRQLDYLQRTLSIFLTNSSDMTEQLELLIDELIKENKQINKSPKHSPESSSSDSKSDVLTTANTLQTLSKKRSAPLAANSKPPPPKRLKSSATLKDDDDDDDDGDISCSSAKKKKNQSEEKLTANEEHAEAEEEEETDDDDNDDIKSKPSESQTNASSSRDIDEFAIELGLVCNKCMVLTEEKDNRLVECHECHAKYHQKCHKPSVSTADISDPRCLWYCSKCRRLITKRQQTQSSIKDTKLNSNFSSSAAKSKANDSSLSTAKKGLSTSITDVTTGLFSFKAKSSDSITSDSTTISHPSISSSNSSVVNGITTPPITKNTNGWASLATGFKEKKTTSEVTSTTTTPPPPHNSSAASILAELTALTTTSNNTMNETKCSPPSLPTTTSSPSVNSLSKQPINGNSIGLPKTSSSSLSSIKSSKPSSPPVLKTALSSSAIKSSQKVLPTGKTLQRISSPTAIARQTSLVKSPPSTATAAYNRLNSSGSNSSGSNSPSSTSGANAKIATGLDFEKRLKQMKKMAAEKSLTRKC